MTLLSTLRTLLSNSLKSNKNVISRQMSEHRSFVMQPSRYQWKKFKDLTHFYLMLGVIPLGLIVVGSNTFIGPATLSETPEGYTPKYWEYYRSPVTRFLARYFFANPQQEYEKYLAYIFVEHEKIRLRQLEKKVKTLMHERQDYQAYYYKPVMAKYYRQSREYYEERLSMRGEK